MKVIFSFVFLLTVIPSVHAQSVPTDFDSDGTSEYVLVTIQNDKSLNWKSFNPISSLTSTLGEIGASGNHVSLSTWKGTSKPQLGVVTLSGKSILWKILNDDSSKEERLFGSKNQTAVSGADFNGNGTSDAAVVKLKGKNVNWNISYDLFTVPAGQASTTSVNFGTSGDRIFFASPDGLSDWIGVFGKSGNKGLMRLRNTISGEVRSSSRFPKSLAEAPRPRPFAVRQADGIDIVGFSKAKGNNTQVFFRRLDGSVVSSATLPGKGDIVVGNFTESSGEEVAIKTSSGYTVLNPFSGATFEVATVSGIAVDQININTMDGSTASPGGGDDDGGNDNPGSDPGNVSSCKSIKSWPGSHIYKTIGSHHFTDVRRNTSGVIIKPGGSGPFPGCIDMVDSKGNVVARMGLYATGGGWAARYYAGIGCGTSTPYSGATVASRARAKTGSSTIYANFGSVCYGPIAADKCVGSTSC